MNNKYIKGLKELKVKQIKDILELALIRKDLLITGLCDLSNKLLISNVITLEQKEIFQYYIDNNRPSKYSSISAWNSRNSAFYWKKGNKKIRIKWIKKNIVSNNRK